MVSLSRHILVMLLLAIFATSCNQGPSLQAYYVDNQEKPSFLSLDVPTSFLNVDTSELSKDQLEAYESIKKLNMLAYKIDNENLDSYKAELAQVKSILDDDKYEELIRGGNNQDGKFMVKFTGDIENIDEFILFGNADDKGFAIVRVLGKNMSADKIMNLSQVFENANVEDDAVKQFMNFFE
ncbi:DUF4252 domain-containing protein [Paucihalobacter sp.]|uniref:DUF4252 domain-containing protein n=1 Tax=Paucihalobacter sp. TaxID=2850405 RepID=UPI002FE2B347